MSNGVTWEMLAAGFVLLCVCCVTIADAWPTKNKDDEEDDRSNEQ
jgi:hypothetical protein